MAFSFNSFVFTFCRRSKAKNQEDLIELGTEFQGNKNFKNCYIFFMHFSVKNQVKIINKQQKLKTPKPKGTKKNFSEIEMVRWKPPDSLALTA